MKLYEIAIDHQKALATLEQIDDLTQEDIQDNMSALTATFEEKALSVGAFIKNLEAEARAIKEAENNMVVRRKRIERQVNGLKDYLLINMCAINSKPISCPEFDIKLRSCPLSIEVIDESKIANKYFTIKKTISKTLIREGLATNDPRLDKWIKIIHDKQRVEIK